jgi:hypothetical protein
VRWELLFADLEAQAEATERSAFDADVADLGRTERAALQLADRLRGHLHAQLTIRLLGGDVVRARLVDVGVDWVMLDDGGCAVVLPATAVAGVEGLSRLASPGSGDLARRVGLAVVLRRLGRDRSGVRLCLLDGTVVTGTIDRVGADHLDLAQHPSDEQRRRHAVRGVLVVPLAALAQIRSAG